MKAGETALNKFGAASDYLGRVFLLYRLGLGLPPANGAGDNECPSADFSLRLGGCAVIFFFDVFLNADFLKTFFEDAFVLPADFFFGGAAVFFFTEGDLD